MANSSLESCFEDDADSLIQSLVSAERTLETEIAGLSAVRAALKNGLAVPFKRTFDLISKSKGRVIVTGIGKSGHIGTKIAASLASTGTPSFFVHASEASHGDLGMVTEDDVVLALSWSGETQELASIVTYTRRFKVPLVAITSRDDSSLGRAADIVLKLPSVAEACPHGLAPTTSALIQLAIGDALAVALLEGRGFTAQDFRVLHPGGRLGASLKTARDIMHSGERIPIVSASTSMSEGIVLMTRSGFGVLGVTDELNQLIGIITDGDLRRHVSANLLEKTAGEIMTREPKTVQPDTLSASILELVNSLSITSVFVIEDGRPVGIVHLHDLLRIGAA
ncbi:MAG: KpsF/GutQ family sugar-phosphate isomerase [Roseibium album]|uniref:KpsF/GutQ family sugar-phosphate isomerase n=1 Tax=Roseibium album TaxID=311410 RepID=UPI000D54F633|nr:KpsF/GutQ family sugar-phosphate isomerase [Roseibium album]MBG6159471.1 arabinose-5-phosphate isomerase [Labrenzia sp. EL_162]MBG6164221.1 arabinose-5-phosphate isomerase [Labrenzia sp. EL_195]MBG6175871.1 arabinose-5-phosphate isomerase [Labrenzia sp. EL_132]MBG6198131.1 arabinose-5-phosphate isomerase [Labrenzia sp. EL_159]MBG6208744.1 arabinose-5-phosphate isomerase [Labrenzia sp. EL_126]MBG6230368.1 arabinose-5-phosphate isomerase [Labrenzia sp. EL_208]MCR9060851.1 KpsF/GutQ family s